MAFENSDLRRELETSNFLYSGLCLFGDNAYINTKYMATPYPNVKQGSKDAYNFYHSQLRICVECAFGMLVFFNCKLILYAFIQLVLYLYCTLLFNFYFRYVG